MTKTMLLHDSAIDMTGLARLTARPSLFQPGEPLFWNDPHISAQMLAAHLDPARDAASRQHTTIDATVNWLYEHLKLAKGAKVIDLGCGPGLYTSRMRQKGWQVTGMDYSERSIAYAKEQAAALGQDIEYIYQDYLTLDHQARYDAAFLIYFDIGVFANRPRDLLLGKIHRALKPGAVFVFDVMTDRYPHEERKHWSVDESGFWRPSPHLVLSQSFAYPEAGAWVTQYVVLEEQGEATVYRTWDRSYSPDRLRPVLARAGFELEECYEDLTGQPFTSDSPTLAVIARRV